LGGVHLPALRASSQFSVTAVATTRADSGRSGEGV
jgi:hypothetical protein